MTGTGKLSSSATSSSLEDLRHSYGSNTWKPTRTWIGRFTKAILCENLQVKWHRPHGAPWSSTGLYYDHKNPSMWTHCLGNNPNKQRDQPRSIFLVAGAYPGGHRLQVSMSMICKWIKGLHQSLGHYWTTRCGGCQRRCGCLNKGFIFWVPLVTQVSPFSHQWYNRLRSLVLDGSIRFTLSYIVVKRACIYRKNQHMPLSAPRLNIFPAIEHGLSQHKGWRATALVHMRFFEFIGGPCTAWPILPEPMSLCGWWFKRHQPIHKKKHQFSFLILPGFPCKTNYSWRNAQEDASMCTFASCEGMCNIHL